MLCAYSLSRVQLCDPIDCSLPGSSHGILQARILEYVAISFSRGSSQPKDWTQVSCIAGRLFTDWAMREAQSSHHVQLTQGEGKLHLLKRRVFKNVWTCFVNHQSRKVECLVIFVMWAMFLVCVYIYACVHLLEWPCFIILFILLKNLGLFRWDKKIIDNLFYSKFLGTKNTS